MRKALQFFSVDLFFLLIASEPPQALCKDQNATYLCCVCYPMYRRRCPSVDRRHGEAILHKIKSRHDPAVGGIFSWISDSQSAYGRYLVTSWTGNCIGMTDIEMELDRWLIALSKSWIKLIRGRKHMHWGNSIVYGLFRCVYYYRVEGDCSETI